MNFDCAPAGVWIPQALTLCQPLDFKIKKSVPASKPKLWNSSSAEWEERFCFLDIFSILTCSLPDLFFFELTDFFKIFLACLLHRHTINNNPTLRRIMAILNSNKVDMAILNLNLRATLHSKDILSNKVIHNLSSKDMVTLNNSPSCSSRTGSPWK
uniref:Uncharacterized protein n=1 Tax=Ditylenchus dipsaci TaxID=166011 RepID=A0A915CQE9_9BILA